MLNCFQKQNGERTNYWKIQILISRLVSNLLQNELLCMQLFNLTSTASLLMMVLMV